jgi:Ca-activated chloride channel homolog
VKRLLASLLAVCGIFSQSADARSVAVQIWQPPRLVLPSPAEQPIQLQTVRIRGEVNGRHALTEISMTFFNPNRRVLEGELQFPLLDGQTIAGFAMDVNGALRDAVPVEKARGQQVFEEIIRGNIDPGLLEVTQGNSFKLRVYPIPAQGVKQVVLRVQETLVDAGGRVAYRLPLGFAGRVGSFAVDVRVNGAAQAPQIIGGVFGNLNVHREGAAWRLDGAQRDFAGEGMLQIAVPASNGVVVSTQRFDGKDYFVADVPVPSRDQPRDVPNVVGLVWDASGSGATRDHGRELALLDAYFRRMKNGEVRLTRIRDVADSVQSFRIVNGDWQALRTVLEKMVYDGATNLGAFKPEASVREYLLFSDGLANYGDQPFAQISVPLYSISAAAKSDAVFLRHVAHRSGGRFIDLTRGNVAEAARALLTSGARVKRLDTSGATQVTMASVHPQGGRLLIAGVLTEANASLQIRLANGVNGGNDNIVNVPLSKLAATGTTAAVQWAQFRVNELDGEYQFNRAEIRRLGQRFKLVTRETSLIVLDRIQDYVRYEIVPPDSLRAEYDRMLANVSQQRRVERASHLETIVRQFEEKISWWNRDFPKEAKRKQELKIGVAGAVERVEVTGTRVGEERADRMEQNRERAATNAPAIASVKAIAPPIIASPAAPAPAAMAKRAMADSVAGMPQEANFAQAQTNATIRLQKWQPDAPYASRMRSAEGTDVYRIYLDERASYTQSTAFFLDVADVLFEKGLTELGSRVLSNLAEMDLENRHILRVLGYRLLQAKQPVAAIPVLKKVLQLSPEEPQSYRDLGLAYAADGQSQKAIESLNEVVIRPWHNRFPGIEQVALAELNAIAATSKTTPDLSRIDPRLMRNLPVDLRAVLTWDADNTDIDLWVTDPNGEKAYYGNRLTYQGGRMTQDFTGGYGPEEFSLKSAKPGKYKVEAQYYGDRRQSVTGATTLQVRLSSHFGTDRQQDQVITMRLKDKRDVVFVGEFEIK